MDKQRDRRKCPCGATYTPHRGCPDHLDPTCAGAQTDCKCHLCLVALCVPQDFQTTVEDIPKQMTYEQARACLIDSFERHEGAACGVTGTAGKRKAEPVPKPDWQLNVTGTGLTCMECNTHGIPMKLKERMGVCFAHDRLSRPAFHTQVWWCCETCGKSICIDCAKVGSGMPYTVEPDSD